MTNKIKKSVLLSMIFILSALTPLFTMIVKADINSSQAGRVSYVVTGGASGVANWDPAIVTGSTFNSLERLFWNDGGIYNSILAENFTTHTRPDEGILSGGVAAYTFNLQQGVTFHDGSEWNATVAKWNFDRVTNISGYVSTIWQATWWFDPSDMEPWFVPGWNLSWYKTNPFGLGYKIPIINKTTVVSEYVLNVTMNKWSLIVDNINLRMISMESYLPWSNLVMKGYGDDPEFPLDNPSIYPGHLIGTGSYMFQFVDNEVTQTALAIKNENYWKKDEIEAEGLFVVDDKYYRSFSDMTTVTNALINGEIDIAGHGLGAQITDLPSILTNPLFTYLEGAYDESIDCVTLNTEEGLDTPCIDIPYSASFFVLYGIDMTTFEGQTPRQIWPQISHAFGYPALTQLPDGIDRTVRRAFTYAWDYEGYTNIGYSGGDGVVCDSPLGVGSIWYNGSIPSPYYNITIAREILLSDSFYAAECTTRGLSMANTTAEWINVGDASSGGNPIKTFKCLAYSTSAKPLFIKSALNMLGFDVETTLVSDVFGDWVATGKAVMYDMFTYLWLNSAYDPMGFMGSGMNLLYRSTNRRIGYNSYNYAHLANDTIDGILAQIPFAGIAAQELYDQLSYDLMNYHAPWIYCGQFRNGVVHNSGWNVTRTYIYTADAAYVGGARKTTDVPTPIPGYPLTAFMIVFTVAVFGIVYNLLKKRKNN